MTKDTVSLHFTFKPTNTGGLKFRFVSRWASRSLKWKLAFEFYKYLFSPKVQPGWKSVGSKYFLDKVKKNLFEIKIYIMVSSEDKEQAE
jgi:hypothetical protein